MIFSTPLAATDYIRNKLGEFYAKRGILQDQYGKALLLRAKLPTGAAKTQAGSLISKLTEALQTQSTLENRLRPFAEAFGVNTGLGVPMVLLAVAIPVALLLYNHLQSLSAYRTELELIERGVLTPDQAMHARPGLLPSLFEGSGIFSTYNLVLYGLIGAGIYFLFVAGKHKANLS